MYKNEQQSREREKKLCTKHFAKKSRYYSSNACVFCILVVDYYLFELNASELHKSFLYFTPTAVRDSVQCYTIRLHRLYDYGCCLLLLLLLLYRNTYTQHKYILYLNMRLFNVLFVTAWLCALFLARMRYRI